MLSIQSGINRNSASFGNSTAQGPRVIILDPRDNNYRSDNFGEVTEITDEFSTQDDSDNYVMTEEEYNQQKDFLNNAKDNVEKTLNNMEDIIGNSKAGKPIKTAGKIILGVISVAMGFVSMKWASLGTWKVGEDIVKSPMAKKIASGMTKPFKDGYSAVSGAVKKSGVGEKLSENAKAGAKIIEEAFDNSSMGKKINGLVSSIKENKTFQKGCEILDEGKKKVASKVEDVKNTVSGITNEKVKSAVSNFFGFSGGVTAGVETIQAERQES